MVGSNDGVEVVGSSVGMQVGRRVGSLEGAKLGLFEGVIVDAVGSRVGR